MGPFRISNGRQSRISLVNFYGKVARVSEVLFNSVNIYILWAIGRKNSYMETIPLKQYQVPVFVKLLSTSDGHVEITGSRTIADPHADRREEGDAQPEQEEELQVEVSVHVRNRPGRHDDKRGPQVLNSLQKSTGFNADQNRVFFVNGVRIQAFDHQK
jgi:hypothetical protein